MFFHSFVLLNKLLLCHAATRFVTVSKEYLVSMRHPCYTKWNQGNYPWVKAIEMSVRLDRVLLDQIAWTVAPSDSRRTLRSRAQGAIQCGPSPAFLRRRLHSVCANLSAVALSHDGSLPIRPPRRRIFLYATRGYARSSSSGFKQLLVFRPFRISYFAHQPWLNPLNSLGDFWRIFDRRFMAAGR